MKYTGKYKEMAEAFRRDGADEKTIERFIREEMETDKFHKGDGTTDIEAVRLWETYPEEAKEMWLHNAFCSNCGMTSFAPGYNLRKDKFGVVIQGKCVKCGRPIIWGAAAFFQCDSPFFSGCFQARFCQFECRTPAAPRSFPFNFEASGLPAWGLCFCFILLFYLFPGHQPCVHLSSDAAIKNFLSPIQNI